MIQFYHSMNSIRQNCQRHIYTATRKLCNSKRTTSPYANIFVKIRKGQQKRVTRSLALDIPLGEIIS